MYLRKLYPQIYYAISAVVYRQSGLSLSSLAMLHETLGITRNTFERVLVERASFWENLKKIQSVYRDLDVREKQERAVVESIEGDVGAQKTTGPDASRSEGVGIELMYALTHHKLSSLSDFRSEMLPSDIRHPQTMFLRSAQLFATSLSHCRHHPSSLS